MRFLVAALIQKRFAKSYPGACERSSLTCRQGCFGFMKMAPILVSVSVTSVIALAGTTFLKGCGLTESKFIDYEEGDATPAVTPPADDPCAAAIATFAATMQVDISADCLQAGCHPNKLILDKNDPTVNRTNILSYASGLAKLTDFVDFISAGNGHDGGARTKPPRESWQTWLTQEEACKT
jgi:hypothetical protein